MRFGKNKPNSLYLLLVYSFNVSSFAEGILLPIYAIFVQKVGGDILDAGLAMGIFLITEAIFTMFVHRFSWTARQRLFLMVLGWIIWLAGICSYLLISDIWMLFISQILTAIGNAIADPIFDQELAHHTDKKIEQYEWGFFEGSKSLVDGLAAIVGAAIASWFGFRSLIIVMIVTATVSFLLILLYIHKSRSKQRIV